MKHHALTQTKVIFLYNVENDDLFAYFPEIIENRTTRNRLSYSIVGQHSECTEAYADESIEATKEQRNALHKELVSIGYDVKIVSK